MVPLNIILTVKDENDIDEVRELMIQQSQLSKQEPGCLRFEVYHSHTDPKIFIINEHWESEEALEVHRQAKACTEIYKPKVLPKVERVPHPATIID
ncbi:MAG: antibiotic biosynthesis monooxygenase [Planctomycetaceae bacterium]|nr:antibiotic biosynthesis monooxygenase [Planctomycetaceae bacterium]